MKKIRILQIIHSLHIGGAEEVVVNLALGINTEKFEMHVCCLKETGVLANRLSKNDIPIHTIQKGKGNKYFNSIIGLRQLIKKISPDIIHTHSDPALINIGPIFLFGKMPPLVHTYHFGNYPHIKKKYLYIQRIFSRFVKQLVAVSNYQRETLLNCHLANKNNIITIYNGVAEDTSKCLDQQRLEIRDQLCVSNNEILIGTIAVLSNQKGIEYLLDAISILKREDIEIKFVIVGGGPLEVYLRNRAVQLGLDDKVIFTGWRNDARKYFAAFDIFLQPSLWEAFSIVLLEAMSSKMPIITTDVGEHKNVIKNEISGLLIKPKSSAEIVKAIEKLINDKHLCSKLGGNAYETYIEKYTINAMINSYEKLYMNMLSE
jgi:glycosyltransferase involved in cell wall biosynthesis